MLSSFKCLVVKTIQATERFRVWFARLRDPSARARIQARLRKAGLGHFGDCAPVGGGVSEMRMHCGPGYRVYFIQRGEELIILLAGGDKGSQAKDIKAAQALAREL